MKFLRSITLITQNGCFKLVHFSKKSGRLSSAGPEILALISHCLANVQPILGNFIPNFKMKHEDSENIKARRVNTIVLNLHSVKRQAFSFGTSGRLTQIFVDYNDLM